LLKCLRKRLAKAFAAARPDDGGHARAGRWPCFSASCDAIEGKWKSGLKLNRARGSAAMDQAAGRG
jgi:hypothetical protein